MAKKLEWIAACLLTALALFLHVSRFQHAGGLWRDEAAAVGLATQPTLGEVYRTFPHEAFPLLFPLAIRTWAAVTGGSDAALRAFGLLVGIGILGALWWNAWSLRRSPPLLSLALLGGSPALLQFGDAIRGYGLGTLFLLLAFGGLAAVIGGGAGVAAPGRRIGALLAALLAAHCLIPDWALLAALGLAAALSLLWLGRRRDAILVLGGGLAVALSLLPYAGPLLAAREWNAVVTSPSPVGPRALLGGLAEVAGAPLPAVKWVWLLALALAALGGIRALVSRGPEGEPGRGLALFGLLAILLGSAGCFAFLAVLRYDPRPWYYLPLLALLASAGDLLLAGLGSSPGRRLAVAVGTLALGVLLFPPARGAAVERQTNVDLVAGIVARAAAPGDLVLVNPWYNGISFARYYHGRAPWLTLPEITDHRFHRYDLLKARMASPRSIDDVEEALGATLAAGHRVWVVGGLHLPKPGRRPPVLPPAPGSRWGWFDVPYAVTWSQQTGVFLGEHATGVQAVDVPVSDSVSAYERLRLLVFDGWRP
jgi:hypothetical protein